MTKEKQLYVSPETESLVIRFEGVICGSNDATSTAMPSFTADAEADW